MFPNFESLVNTGINSETLKYRGYNGLPGQVTKTVIDVSETVEVVSQQVNA